MAKITTEEGLRKIYKPAAGRAVSKIMTRIDPHAAAFIGFSPFVLLSTQGPDGLGDVTPRGDGPGFVEILDDTHLALPDRPGNNMLDNLTNILSNPGVGLLFLVPGVNETLRVNGVAEIRDDEELRARFEVNGKLPATVLVIEVREAFLHCAKALMRSKLWDPSQLPDERPLPTIGKMLADQIGDSVPEEPEAEMIERYQKALY